MISGSILLRNPHFTENLWEHATLHSSISKQVRPISHLLAIEWAIKNLPFLRSIFRSVYFPEQWVAQLLKLIHSCWKFWINSLVIVYFVAMRLAYLHRRSIFHRYPKIRIPCCAFKTTAQVDFGAQPIVNAFRHWIHSEEGLRLKQKL